MAWKRNFKKGAGKVSTAVKKRYGIGKGRGGFKFSQVAKDVAMLKSRLNVEKKFIDQDLYLGQTVGQSRDESAGYFHTDISPIISQGVGESARVGNSIKTTGLVARLNFKAQQSTGTRIAKVCLVRSLTEDANPAQDIWDDNPLTNFIDYHSPRNYASMRGKDNSHKIIATKYCKISNTGDGEDGVAHMKLAVKLNDIIRYSVDSDTTPEDFRYHLYIFLDYGNCDIFNATSNAGCLEQTPASGAIFNQQVRVWYVDN